MTDCVYFLLYLALGKLSLMLLLNYNYDEQMTYMHFGNMYKRSIPMSLWLLKL